MRKESGRKKLYILYEACMTKEVLIKKIGEILKTDLELKFLTILKKEELETLIACVRVRVDQAGER
jgi:hypothetical protein